ncbi:MAG TPA: STAS domain-containing protein [Spirochaetota bacterium]|nr:STAS domain-containing protein [Spirochaetota bacterium]
MSFEIELLNLSLINKENVDYDMIIFYMNYPEKIDIDTSREIMLFLTTLIKGGAKKIIVDMKKVTLIDSAGISTLISATKQIRKNNGDLVLSHVNDSIQSILDIIKIEKFIKIFHTGSDAVQYFRYIQT